MPSAPRYRYHIFICINFREQGECCAAKGSADLRDSFKEEIKKRGLTGEVRANKAGCMDACSMGPSVVVYPDGVWYTVWTREDVTEIMDRHIGRGEIVERLLMGNNAEGDRSPSEPSPKPQALARNSGSPKTASLGQSEPDARSGADAEGGGPP